MKIYVIKHKGANKPYNLDLNETITFSDGGKIISGEYFWRFKDAKKMLRSYSSPEFFEIVSAEIK